MKTKLLALTALLIVGAFLVSSCGAVGVWPVKLDGSGKISTLKRDYTNFDGVEVSHPFHVDIRQGDRYNVVIRIDDNLVRYLRVAKHGSTLQIGLQPRWNYRIERATLHAEVTLPELTSLKLSGASHATIDGLQTSKSLNLSVAVASHLTGAIEASDVDLHVIAASHVALSGSANNMAVHAWMASQARLADLQVEDASVQAHGASHVTVNPSGQLNVTASSASHVRYVGQPRLGKVQTLLASTLREH